MTQLRWDRVGEIYHAALARSPDERPAYLAQACGADDDLLGEVESLLSHAMDASGFLETNALELAGRAVAAARQESLVGRRLGQYEIVSLVGAGGMGQVYLAHDARLGRDVAIKCLPPDVAADPGLRARLEREARVLATLNHPNIAAIYGVEEADGVIGLVLEMVEGRTLAELALSMRDALGVARQIADALEAAHEKGIIHRDLKPANVKVTTAGVVKVLDFGLAKAIAADPVADDGTPDQTQAGMILGTAAYMSPEQARGKPLDRRTDIWSFGCVLYEMIANRAAFGGETATDCLVKVLESDPDWSALPRGTPDPIRRLLRRCLNKDVTSRLRDIADARLEILEALSTSAGTGGVSPPARHRRRWPLIAAAVALTAAAVIGSYLAGGGASASAPGVMTRLTFRQGNTGKARFAPDGETVVYGAAWDGEPYRLYSTRLGSAQSRAIDFPPADLLALSKTGQLAVSLGRPAVDGWEPRGTLAVAKLAGGGARELYSDVVGADWTPDGSAMALVRRVGAGARLEFPVGTTIHEAPVILPPRISPDGTRVCFFGGPAYGQLWVAERGAPARQLATPLGRGGHCAWTPDGREIWVESAGGAMHMTLEAVDLNGRRRTVASYTGMIQIEDISADGKVLISAGVMRYAVHGVSDRGERDLTVFDATRVHHLSADGRHVLLWDNSPGAQRDRVFLRNIDGSPPIPVGPGAPAALSPDGKWAAVIGNGVTNERIRNRLTLFPTSVGTARTIDLHIACEPLGGDALGRTNWARRTYDFSGDGTRLLIPFGHADGRPPRVYVYDFTRNRTTPITPEGITGTAAISPDGRFVAVNHPPGVVLHSVDDGGQRELRGAPESGQVAAWSADGRALFVVEQSGDAARVFRREIDTGRRELVRELRAHAPAGVTAFEVFVSRGGQAYAYGTSLRLMNLYVIEGLR